MKYQAALDTAHDEQSRSQFLATVDGQRHDRTDDDSRQQQFAPMLAARAGSSSNDVEVSLSQKMLSAVTGSILTSILGASPFSHTFTISVRFGSC